ncbi:karyopherin Kap95 [Coemansia sp. RSA 989]|nr:armadillo-type protein [Coemansia mojavensis]KAJ1739268.1 karyopherin Kap95 [Coemansia sp. RSA 1086]KAJ1749127.1 karyopherin Kap95 [Coemansia sp. RSA 1821]KAJ1863278.1 karyopherin Kap95 [Coemansia sp. RSA 989]KAJ1871093.1 karyopherin Kap95 [Coemansia sp. RSA 990]KAJ2631450.1 karyopherin Kap95 [Coemansia sp. RSA 1290]KAJ2652064.1 karyopherin Kap95 [Coemansia sp. RSA 1250]KAJ2675185.1 karyopherin Kap95 [Coemansia sp. RSA 1085]
MSFAEILGGTLSSDANIREQATRALESAENENFPQYVLSLTQELANESAQAAVRTAAGIALKNALTAKDESLQEQHSQRWLQVDESVRGQVKQGAMVTLGSENRQATTAAAQAIAAITATELPQGQWLDVITLLLQNVSTNNTGLKVASLQTIGFICESINPDILATQSNPILTAVVQGANSEETSQEVRYAAITALLNSLEFVRQNFENEGERNVIMQTVCEATQSPDGNVQVAAFECLVRIMQLYYDKMRFYMEKALYGLTVIGMKHEDEKIALQAIEFWSTVCDEEIELQIEEEAQDPSQPMERENYQFAKTALPQVLPTLLFLLTKQDEDADEDEWNVSMAAATCLSLLAQAIGNDIVAPVIPFVEQHIRNPDWHYREAAVMAFGSILDGPDPNVLTPLVSQALPVLIEMVKDQVVQVKDSAAWTLGRVCDLPIECIQLDVHLHNMISALVTGLEDSPRIVANCCWAIMNLTEQLGGTDIETYPLSQYFEGIITTLMRITETNVNENNSRTSAYEAMATLASTGAQDTHAIIAKLGVAILDRLDTTVANMSQAVGMDDRLAMAELQSNLLNVLTNVARTMGRQISEISDRIMTSVLQLLNTSGKQTAAAEDAFLLVGALITALEGDFTRYLESFSPFLYNALQNHEEYQLCSISVGLIGDICRSLGPDAAQYCDNFMSILLQNLESNVLHRDVKPGILSCFGDIALAIGGRFETYLEVTFRVLMSACNLSAGTQAMDYDTIDYNNQLRVGIFEAFVGITQGLKADGKAQLIQSHVQTIMGFMNFVYNDQTRSDDVTKAMIGLLGDLADAFPNGQIREFLQGEWIQALIREGRSSARGSSLRVVSRWARDMVKQATA